MRVTLADVISLNGKITQGDNPDIHAWSSAEDWEHFVQLRDKHEVIVIDRHTYETVRPPAEPGKLRVVLTSQPEKFATVGVPGQLEFANVTPEKLVAQLAERGCRTVLVAGSSEICTNFLAAGLVDDLYLTFEPVIFGTGKPMLAERELNLALQLKSVRKLNARGTLLAQYAVQKDSAT